MAISVPKRKPKKFKKSDYEDRYEHKLSDPCLCRLLSKAPVTLLFLFFIFLWSSSSTFLPSSVVHVCVSSRKLTNLYCLSAGAQPSNHTNPLIQPNNSQFPVFERVTENPGEEQDKPPYVEDSAKPGSEEIQTYAVLPQPLTREEKSPTYDGKTSFSPSNPILKEDSEFPVLEAGTEKLPSTSAILVPNETPKTLIPYSNPREEQEKTPYVVDSEKAESGEFQTYTVLEEKSPTYDGNSSSSTFPNPILKEIDKAKAEELAYAKKHVEEQLGLLRSYIPKSKTQDCDGRGIYVYDLPSKFNKDLTSICHDMISWLDFCKFLSNDGIGESIPELGNDWYNTHQYSLEPIFHNRALKHPCRVDDWEDAKLFYVPFYGGLDILRWHFKNVSNEVKDALSNELMEWLEKQKPWKRHFGMDHVFVLGKISWDFRRLDGGSWGTRLLELDEMQHPIKLLIERQPWETNDVGVPHPTYFHPSSDEAIIQWQSKIRGAYRGSLVSFAGTPRVPPKGLREKLIEQCTSAPNNTCNFFDCREKSCVNPALIIKLFTESEFCLQPPGDSPTRKSFFDSLVGGCIPVVFDPMTAHYQYPWHLPQDYTKYSVFIDKDEVKTSEVNVIERLMKISLKEREEMRKYIIDELMPKLVYSNPNSKLQRFEDAFSVAVNSLLQMVATKVP